MNSDDCTTAVCPIIPAELTRLARWACWRTWTKRNRVTREPVHPADGKNLRVSRPDDWAAFDEVVHRPAGRKPAEGIGLLVTAADGLAVVTNADFDLPGRLGPNLVYAERAVAGGGLTLIVRSGVHGAKTGRFVPLSGRPPCQDQEVLSEAPSPDPIRTESGPPDQENDQSGRTPYQAGGTNPDERRTFLSSSPQNNYCSAGEDPIRTEVGEYARAVCEQGKSGDGGKWVYGLIGVFRRHGLTPQAIPHNLLLTFATAIGADAGDVQRLVLARWKNWRPHKAPLADALKAVHADPSLLTELAAVIIDRPTLLAAGMCKYLGAGGHPFALSGRVLAEVLGLHDQQKGSEVVLSLVGLNLIKKVKEADHPNKMAAEYVLVGAVAGPVAEPVESQTETPLLTPKRPVHCRPGHSTKQTEEFRFRSRLGGYLTGEHYLAEMVLARKLVKEGKELFDGFWARPVIGPWYARQVVAARALLKDYSADAVCRALRSKAAEWVYSLAMQNVRDLASAEQTRLDRQAAARSVAVDPPAPPSPEAPRPPFVGRTPLSKLMEL